MWIADDKHRDPGGIPYLDFAHIIDLCLVFVLLWVAIATFLVVGNATVCFTMMCVRTIHTAVNSVGANFAELDLSAGGLVLMMKLVEFAGLGSHSLIQYCLYRRSHSSSVVVFVSVLTFVAKFCQSH